MAEGAKLLSALSAVCRPSGLLAVAKTEHGVGGRVGVNLTVRKSTRKICADPRKQFWKIFP